MTICIFALFDVIKCYVIIFPNRIGSLFHYHVDTCTYYLSCHTEEPAEDYLFINMGF